jgi:hypothetical protein
MTLQQAIARQEGFGIAGALATTNHNPGNLIWGPFAKARGALANDRGYARFATDEDGWAALTDLLAGPSYEGLTVEAAINKYCPAGNGTLSAGNLPDVYVQHVCEWLDCAPSTIIDGLLGLSST